MKRDSSIFLLILLLAACLSGCGGEGDPEGKTEVPKVFDPMALELSDADLIQGREIWVATCIKCHLKGLGGAPKIGDTHAWAPRIAQGKATLYAHAIHGFSGPLMTEMPPKGGFTNLSDDEVRLAVDFVVHASR